MADLCCQQELPRSHSVHNCLISDALFLFQPAAATAWLCHLDCRATVSDEGAQGTPLPALNRQGRISPGNLSPSSKPQGRGLVCSTGTGEMQHAIHYHFSPSRPGSPWRYRGNTSSAQGELAQRVPAPPLRCRLLQPLLLPAGLQLLRWPVVLRLLPRALLCAVRYLLLRVALLPVVAW